MRHVLPSNQTRAATPRGDVTHDQGLRQGLRKVAGASNPAALRAIWALRRRDIDAAIPRAAPAARHACFTVRHGSFATSVHVDARACIAWRYPEAVEYAWDALSDVTLRDVLHREQWHDFVPVLARRWDGVALESVGPPPQLDNTMLEVVFRGTQFLFQRVPCSMNAATAAPDRGDWAIASACPVQVSVEIGHTRIPLRVVDSLRAGDVVKIVTPKPCLRASPRVGATLALDNGVFIVSDIPLTSDVPSADSSTAHSSSHSPRTPDAPSSLLLADDLSLDESAPLSVGELPVGLSFSFAPFPMTVAELSSLRPGDVVPLEPGARLLIYANGRQIGRAEMVEVEGALAAEIAVLHLSQREKNA